MSKLGEVSDRSIGVVYRASTDDSVLAHPVHQSWAKSIGATELSVPNSDIPTEFGQTFLADSFDGMSADLPERDVYLFEAPGALYSLPTVKRSNPDSTILYLHTSWRLQGPNAYGFGNRSSPLRQLAHAERFVDAVLLKRLLRTHVDGIITVSEMTRSELTRFFDGPIGVVRPFIEDDEFQNLKTVDPSYGSNSIATIGTYREHKGVDQLVSVWPKVRSSVPDAEFHIVGSGYPETFKMTPGVTIHGYVDDLKDILERCGGYVHPARYDASPVSSLEAMAAGLPPLVTLGTGTRSEVSRVSERLIVPSTEEGIYRGVTDYLRTSATRRREWGAEARDIAERFCKFARSGEFAETVDAVLSHLSEG